MAEVSVISICNQALMFIKAGRITAFDGKSEAARVCEQAYEHARDKVFEEHNWNVCLTRMALAPLATTPAYGFTHEFLLPADPWCIRVLEVVDAQGNPVVHKPEGRKILANTDDIRITYVARITDPSLYSPLMRECIARRLAADVVFSLTGVGSMVQLQEDLYQKVLAEARSIDASQGTQGETYIADSFIIGLLD